MFETKDYFPQRGGFGAIESLVMLMLLAAYTWVLVALFLGTRDTPVSAPPVSERVAVND